MPPANSPLAKLNDEFVFTRVFRAPRSLVWKAWTDPVHLAKWWGPAQFTNPVCEFDLRPGGAIRIHMCAPDGHINEMSGKVEEFTAPERLVFTSALPDGAGGLLFEIRNTVTLADQGATTLLTIKAQIISLTDGAAPMFAGMDEGWCQSLDRLQDLVEAENRESSWNDLNSDLERK